MLTFISIILFFSLAVISVVLTVRKHRSLYLQGKIARSVFLRNIALDISGILIAVTLAGLLGRYLSQAATLQISHSLTRIIIGILIGVLIGVCVGLLVKRTWGLLTKA